MHCLVTGASGFIGSALVPGLLARGHAVTVLLRPSSSGRRLGDWLASVRVVHGSLEDLGPLAVALREAPVDAVFHLAWSGATAAGRDNSDQILVNATSAVQLWKIMHEAGCKVWIGLGSQAEYGPQAGVLTEDLPPQPDTAYGVAKLATGLMTRKLSEMAGMQFAWLRLLSAYGPGDDERHLVPYVVRTLLAGDRPRLTKGEQVWDFLYIDDVASALCAVLDSDANGAFNLASGTATTIRAAVDTIRDMIDPSLPVGFGEIAYAPGQVMHLAADISRLTAAAGWTPKVGLEEGLRRTVDWGRSHYESTRTVAHTGDRTVANASIPPRAHLAGSALMPAGAQR